MEWQAACQSHTSVGYFEPAAWGPPCKLESSTSTFTGKRGWLPLSSRSKACHRILAFSSALEQLLECARERGDALAKALAEKVDQERKATANVEVTPGTAVAPNTPTKEARLDTLAPVLATGQREGGRASSPAGGSPLNVEQGSLTALRDQDTDPATMPATPSPEQQPGVALGADALAVEEARKRIHATLDAGEDPLNNSVENEGQEVLERLHLRPASKASREYPEETPGLTDSPQGTVGKHNNLPGSTGKLDTLGCHQSCKDNKLGGSGFVCETPGCNQACKDSKLGSSGFVTMSVQRARQEEPVVTIATSALGKKTLNSAADRTTGARTSSRTLSSSQLFGYNLDAVQPLEALTYPSSQLLRTQTRSPCGTGGQKSPLEYILHLL
eukprot:5090926-Amphidinium_carterae.2